MSSTINVHPTQWPNHKAVMTVVRVQAAPPTSACKTVRGDEVEQAGFCPGSLVSPPTQIIETAVPPRFEVIVVMACISFDVK